VAFWDALDIIGVNAYFKLRRRFDHALTDEAMRLAFAERWDEIFSNFDRMRAELGQEEVELMFTELGYTFRKNSTFEPWSYTTFSIIEWDDNDADEDDAPRRQLVVWGEQPVDHRERQIAI